MPLRNTFWLAAELANDARHHWSNIFTSCNTFLFRVAKSSLVFDAHRDGMNCEFTLVAILQGKIIFDLFPLKTIIIQPSHHPSFWMMMMMMMMMTMTVVVPMMTIMM